MNQQQPDSLIFDLDGTLVDTADEFVVVVQALRAEHELAPMNPQRIRASVSNGARSLVTLGLGIPEEAAEFEAKRLRLLELYSEVLGSVAAPYPGIPALLVARRSTLFTPSVWLGIFSIARRCLTASVTTIKGRPNWKMPRTPSRTPT